MRKRNTIAKTWEELSMEEQMEFLLSENQQKLSKFSSEDGFHLSHAALIDSLDADTGERRELLILKDEAGALWATISPTFIDSFVQISNFLESHDCRLTRFTIEYGTSKRDRVFMTCRMDAYEKRS